MKKILVMEDDEILNAGLCYNIQKKEMLPVSVYSIKDAKEKLKKETFDLILLDVNLPDGNGFDFAKEAMPKYNTPFIFLTAHNLEEEIIKGLQLGADDYIVKPFSIKVVMEKIQVVLSPAKKCQEVNKKFLLLKKGRTYPLVKISFFKRYGFVKSALFYAAMLHLAALYCLICSCGGMISKGLLSRSIANIMLHTLCETAPIATSFGFDSHFLR